MKQSKYVIATALAIALGASGVILNAAAADARATRTIILGRGDVASVTCAPGLTMKAQVGQGSVLVACGVPQPRGPIGGPRPAPTATPIPIVWPVQSSAPVSPIVSPIVSVLPTPAP